MQWKTKGMTRDSSVSAFSADFAFENVNLRLATNEGNTMMSWVNEKGTKEIEITSLVQAWDNTDITTNGIEGTPIGTAILNHQLVVFTTTTGTTSTSTTPDRIYVLKYADENKTTMTGRLLFKGNLKLHVQYPLETMVAYEADYIQKVYWTDNRNQPRLINIAASTDKIVKWNTSATEQSYFFDFVPSFEMKEEDVTITKRASSGGLFAPGVIQYAITYINKYGQESNIAYLSTLYYLAQSDRGASPEEKTTSSFEIKVNNPDYNFDYIRLYSIQRTSLNAEPLVKKLDDIPITKTIVNDIVYIDNGTTGSTMDPTELLYIGGKEIKVLTMADKDNTLFMGNITQKNSLVTGIQDYYDSLRESSPSSNMGITFKTGVQKTLTFDHAKGTYSYTNTLKNNLREVSTFKGGETYRFGFQLQKRTGEWSEPIFMNDVKNSLYPSTTINSDVVSLAYAEANINVSTISQYYNNSIAQGDEDFYSIFKSIRPVIVYPSISDRNVLCQGVINPTVFNAEDRIDNSPFAQASWFFRPYVSSSSTDSGSIPVVDPTDLSIEVTGIDAPSDADTQIANSIDSYFSENNLLQDMYVLVGDVSASYLNTILARGYLRWHEESDYKQSADSDDRTEEHTEEDGEEAFAGVIILESTKTSKSTYKCAFLKAIPFTEEDSWDKSDSQTGTVDRGQRYYLSEEIDSVKIDKVKYKFYSGMKTTLSKNLYYYPSKVNESAPNPYVFMFAAGGILYTVSFTAISVNDSSYITDSDNAGNALRFKHYDSLYTLDDFTDNGDPIKEARNLEIEGAVRSYANAFSTSSGVSSRSEESNTQFFVDQSILTLNSPDIEFDTDVQSYGCEGLKLRVIGAVPITAYQSSHEISISTNMLEIGHNIVDSSSSTSTYHFGKGEKDTNVIHDNISINAGNRLISDYIWNDVVLTTDTSQIDGVKAGNAYNYLVYPWQRSGSMNNDTRVKESTKDGTTITASSYLGTKKEGHSLYSLTSTYFSAHNLSPVSYENLSAQIHLTENSQILNMRLARQKSDTVQMNYYPNIDKVLVNSNGYKVLVDYKGVTTLTKNWSTISSPVSMKYKSTSHAVIALRADNQNYSEAEIPIMPYGEIDSTSIGNYINDSGTTFWGSKMTFSQTKVPLNDLFSGYSLDYLWLAELYKDVDSSSRFGGKGKTAVLSNQWLIGGEAKAISSSDSTVTLEWTEGDTYYQRYDCLKTYASTTDDVNQNTEILSFMCETHTNIDGRYDRNRGQLKAYTMSPTNFNLLNPVYSQQNNFFTYRKLDTDENDELSYPNHIYYSKTKESGADVDQWTNITLGSTLEMDGDKGEVTSLNRYNDQLIAFQDSGVSQILYNENTQISTTAGVPIEIANSGKVQGKRYISDTIGCSNKWSLVQTPVGIYFMDNNDKSIYLYNGQLGNISSELGFNSWAKQNIPSADNEWNPVDYDDFRAMYDKQNREVLFINKDIALTFSEKFKCFTSFYDYGNAPYFENLDDTGIWLKGRKLWKHQAGEYCNFFGENKSYSMTLIGCQAPTVSKIFTNLEFRACVEGEGTYIADTDKFTPTLPFDSLEVWNEYQHGITTLKNRSKGERFTHGKDNEVLARKFRVWACDIPRDNAPIDASEEVKGIKRFKVRPLDRIRNPWVYLKLKKDAATSGTLNKVEVHDIMAAYFS